MLAGREAQCALIERLLAEARSGRSNVLLIRGAPGIGKTALLQHGVTAAASMQVLSVSGVESESELAFSGLADLVRPLASELRRLPPGAAAALAGALSFGPAGKADRFSVYIATLNLLSAAAETKPVLVVADDLQWLDGASQEALLAVARRLDAEGIVMLLAVRSAGEPVTAAWSLPELELEGLDRKAAGTLLGQAIRGRTVAPHVQEQLLALAEGNPLALLEVPAALSDDQLAGTEPLTEPLPVGPGLERMFGRRFDALPEGQRRCLLIAAANDQSDPATVTSALRRLGLKLEDLEAAETAGLVELDGLRIRFRHPLLRAVIYHGAAPARRRAAHRTLAAVLLAAGLAERAAWHLAAAAVAPDEAVAAMLEQAAATAQQRGGQIVAARALERAASLTPTPDSTQDGSTPGGAAADNRARRLLAAASAAYAGGRLTWARTMLEAAVADCGDPRLRADIQHMRGNVEMWRGPAPFASRLLTDEAEAVEGADPARAAMMLADAAMARIMTGGIEQAVQAAAHAGRAADRSGDPGTVRVARAAEGIARSFMGETATAYPAMLAELEDAPQAGQPAFLAPMVAQVAIWAEKYGTAQRILDRIVEAAHRVGALGELAFPLAVLADARFRTGAWADAYAAASEAVRVGTDTGQESALAFGLVQLARIEAGRGMAESCREHVEQALALAEPRGGYSIHVFAAAALGLLDMGLARFEAAAETMEWLGQAGMALREPTVVQWLPDAVEAGARSGRRDPAMLLLERLDEQAALAPGRWARAVAARCHGILAGEQDYEAAFNQALAWHGPMPGFERARTELCLGVRLRRSKRKTEAQVVLRRAAGTFGRLGAAPWAERANSELAAGGAARAVTPDSLATLLTAQELQIALAVASGSTNRAAGIALFLSEKTIETHLSNVYRKLGLHRRSELAALFARERLTPALSKM
jgi:DNA-binding CsgD family transcriptional regulator/predicted ATPase